MATKGNHLAKVMMTEDIILKPTKKTNTQEQLAVYEVFKGLVDQYWSEYSTKGKDTMSRKQLTQLLCDALDEEQLGTKTRNVFLANAKFNSRDEIDKFELTKILMRSSGLAEHVSSRKIEKYMGYKKVYCRECTTKTASHMDDFFDEM